MAATLYRPELPTLERVPESAVQCAAERAYWADRGFLSACRAGYINELQRLAIQFGCKCDPSGKAYCGAPDHICRCNVDPGAASCLSLWEHECVCASESPWAVGNPWGCKHGISGAIVDSNIDHDCICASSSADCRKHHHSCVCFSTQRCDAFVHLCVCKSEKAPCICAGVHECICAEPNGGPAICRVLSEEGHDCCCHLGRTCIAPVEEEET